MATKVINALTFGDTYVLTTPYATCSTAAGTAAKVATITPGSAFSLETGVRVSVKFTNALSVAAPTLNVNSSGAKAIYFRGATLSSAQYWAAGSTVDFVYDGTYWQMLGSQHNSTYSLSSFGVTATAAELNTLDGITATVTELNYTDGVTSNIQTQLNNKVSTDMGYVNKSITWDSSSYIQHVILLFPVPQSTTYCGHNFIDGKFFCWKTGENVYDTIEVNANCVYGSLRYHLEQFGDHPTTELCVCKYNNIQYYALKCPYHANPYTNVTFVGRIRSDITGGTATVALPLDVPYYNENTATVLNSEIKNSLTTTLTTTYVTSASTTALYSKGGFAGNLSGNASTATNVAWSGVTSKPSYYDAKAIKGITRSGTTFTYTCMDGTTGTFTQQDDNTTYTFTNNAPTLAWGTTSTIGTVGGTALTVTMPSNPNTDTYGRSGDTSSKIYLIGTTTQSTGNKTTYSHDTAYVGTDGCLYSGGTKVLTAHQSVSNSAPTLAWGTTSTVGTIGGTALTVTMPANPNSDTKVTQNAVITTAGSYPVILGNSTSTTAVTGSVNKSANLLFDPSSSTLIVGSTETSGYEEEPIGNLYVSGDAIIGGGSDTYGIIPGQDNYSHVGTANYRWYEGHFSNMYCDNYRNADGTLLTSQFLPKSGGTLTGATTVNAGVALQLNTLKLPTTSGGTTYGVGTAGQVLKSNGTTVYWGSDSNSTYGYPMILGVVCSSSDTVAAKVTYLSGFSSTHLVPGATVFVRFTYPHTSTTAATFNLSSTGAKTIKRAGKSITATNGNTWAAYEIVKLVYDGTYWQYISMSGPEWHQYST